MFYLTICRVVLLSFVFLFPREAEMQRPTITPEFLSPLLVVEGQRVTLNWTYNLHGSALRFVEFNLRGGAFIVQRFSGFSTEIANIYRSRVIANMTDTFTTITFLSVNSTADSKEYTFSVRSVAGQTLRGMELVVQFPPSIDIFSAAQVVVEGNPPATITLFCNATGKPGPTVTWTKVFTNGSDSDILFTGNRFEISNNRSNAGRYRCKADNGIGSAINETINVTVKSSTKPENVQFTVNDSSICLGDAFSLSCSGDGYTAIHTYLLFENDTLVTTSRSPIVWAKTASNEGETVYRCEVNNTLGTANATRTVTVNVPASIKSIEDKFITEKDNTSFVCNASGIPHPTAFWVNVQSGERTNSSELEFTNINRSESGEYRCEASNECGTAVETVIITVQYPPEKVHLMTNATENRACLNDVVNFTCSADAVPSAMSFQLFENNVPMERSSSGMWVKKQSRGGMFVYRCVANNSLGSANSADVSMTVIVPSSIQPLRYKTITEGGNLNLSCNASGSSPLAVSWVRISSGQRFDGRVLQLTNINRSEARDYKCEASNECGNASEIQNLNVQYPPDMVWLMTNATANKACLNDVVNFTCSADALPSAMSFQLFENSVPMERSSSGMWFKKLSEGGVFVYRCVANNSVGPTNSTDVPIIVNVPASIQPLQNETITEGGNLNLSCNASGSSPLAVSWIRISSGQRFNGRVLQLTNISRSEARDYRCEASNDCANVSQAQSIDVQYKPEGVQLMTNASANKACLNDFLKLTCSVGDANPRMTSFQLFRNSTGLGKSDSGMWVKTLSNSGVSIYKCEANNSVGTAKSSRVPITVNEAPAIAPIPDATVIVNNKWSLTCTASGVPAPAVSWVKVGSGQRTNGSVLQFTNIKRNEAGEYRCEAINECGSTSQAVSVTVEFPLSIGPLRNKTVTKGQSVILFCNVSGQPTPSVSWTHVRTGRKFYNAAWDVTITDERNLGIYRCDASNMYGNTSDIISVLFVGGFCESTCSNGRACRAIGQFHSCLCSRGKKGTNCQGTEKLGNFVNARFKFVKVQFEDVYTNLEDPKTKKLTKEIREACFYEYKKQDYLLESARVTKLSLGSVIADVELKFLNEVSESEIKELTMKMTNDGKLGNLSVTSVVGPTLTPFSTSVLSTSGKLDKDAIYGPIIGGLGVILMVVIICLAIRLRKRPGTDRENEEEVNKSHFNQGLENENTLDSEITGPGNYMELHPVGESADTRTEPSPYLEISEYAPLHPATRSWEVPRQNIVIEKVIGQGAFGQVAQGTASQLRGREGTTRVAIKMLKVNARETDREDLMSELEVMKKLKPHPHVIKLMGCVTESDPILVIIEYVPYGDLLGYLRKSRGLNDTYFKDPDVKPQTILTSQQLMKFAWQVAEGMRYLSFRNIIHRDLAARNVLVGEQEVCKVTDFGMARDVNQENIYQKKSKGRIPVKWTAYEALLYGLYTTQSDVWSYGVVLYEIFTVGGVPYPRRKGREMYELLSQGYRMPKPHHVDDTLYQIMLNCWQEDPESRPTFEMLGRELKQMENQHKRLIHMEDYNKKLYENVDDLIF